MVNPEDAKYTWRSNPSRTWDQKNVDNKEARMSENPGSVSEATWPRFLIALYLRLVRNYLACK